MSLAIALGVIAFFSVIVAGPKIARAIAPRRFGWSPKAVSMVLVDIDSNRRAEDMQAMAVALQSQIVDDFYPIWGVTATVRVATPDAPPVAGETRIEFRRVPGVGDENALAVHDVDEHGVPLARVFPFLCLIAQESTCAAASHEALELLADPLLRDCVQLPDGRIAAKEVCDQVQTQTYKKGDMAVSNFVTPQNFAPSTKADDRYDFLGKLSKPFEVAEGGYAQVLDPSKGWIQLGAPSGYRAQLASHGIASRAGVRRDRQPS